MVLKESAVRAPHYKIDTNPLHGGFFVYGDCANEILIYPVCPVPSVRIFYFLQSRGGSEGAKRKKNTSIFPPDTPKELCGPLRLLWVLSG
jgi:hypothetical protein